MMKLLGGSLLVAAACIGLSAGQQPRSVTLFEGARLIAGDGRPPIESSAFIVDRDTFTSVGGKGLIQVPAGGAVRVDLTGRTVMPAIVDAHTHPGYRKRLSFSADNYTRDTLLDTLDRLAYYGVAATLEMGTGRGDVPFQLRTESHAGAALFRTAGRGFAMPDAGPGVPMRDAAYGVTTDEQARTDVQALAAKHVDIIKIWVDDRGRTVPKLTPALYRAIIDEAHSQKLRVVAHVFELGDAKDLIRAGIDGFAHLPRDVVADDELVSLVKQKPDLFFTLTLWSERRGIFGRTPGWLDDPLLREGFSAEEVQQLAESFRTAPEDELERSRKTFEIEKATLAKLRAAGARFGVGTDSGGVSGGQFFGWAAQIEMESMVAAGFTPAQAIGAATSNSARIVGLDKLGTVAPGKSADFLVLDANPLADIGNTRSIRNVYLRGQRINRAALRERWKTQ
jgi:imidazolonepropionase-like amidohydrolase